MKPTHHTAIVLQSILAGLQIIAGGTVLTDVFPTAVVGLFILIVAGIQGGYSVYNQLVQVVPTSQVVAVATADGTAAIAGPAAAQETGSLVATVNATDSTQP